MSRKLKGTAAAPGVAIAPLVHFHGTLDHIPVWKVGPEGTDVEQRRFQEAIGEVTCSIQALQQELSTALTGQDVRIYDAQVSILHDPTLAKDVAREIALHGVNAEVALQRVIARYESVFENMTDPA